jgi:hypothetical protein
MGPATLWTADCRRCNNGYVYCNSRFCDWKKRIIWGGGAMSLSDSKLGNRSRNLALFVSLALFFAWFISANAVLAQQQGAKGNVLNPYGTPVGAVLPDGKITNPYGTAIGSVDDQGNIYNVSKMLIGKVDSSGKVTNQSGTPLCTVDGQGNVYNVNGNKVGSVDAGGNIFLIGGAARLLFYMR